jgi:hypothetical protein
MAATRVITVDVLTSASTTYLSGCCSVALIATDPKLTQATLIWPVRSDRIRRPLVGIAATLTAMGHPIGADTVRAELTKLGFSRQSDRKADEGSKHPDRNVQFAYINAKVIAAQARKQPVNSVDTKKKELIGNFKNAGSDCHHPKGDPRRVNVHDFEDKTKGKIVPYGVYDVTANVGFVSIGAGSPATRLSSPCSRSAAGSLAWDGNVIRRSSVRSVLHRTMPSRAVLIR